MCVIPHVAAPELFKAVRHGQFPQLFADLYAEIGLNADEYAAIGAELERVMRMQDGNSKDTSLRRLAVWIAQLLGLNGRVSDDPGRQTLVNDVFELARRHDGTRPWEAPPRTVLVGYVVGVATFAKALALPLDPDKVALVAHRVAKSDGLPLSISDVRGVMREMTECGPLADWVCEKDAAELRLTARGRLLQFLRSRDL